MFMNSDSKHRRIFALLLLTVLLLLSSCDGNADASPVDTTVGTTPTSATTTMSASTTTAPITTVEPTPPTTEPETQPKTEDAPVTEEVKKDCYGFFSDGLATVGKSIALDRALTADELAKVEEFVVNDNDARLILSIDTPFYRPEDASIYRMLYAAEIEVDADPFTVAAGFEGSAMTATRIASVVKEYMGIDMIDSMWDELKTRADYYEDLDVYAIWRTDDILIYAQAVYGYATTDGKILAHMEVIGDMDHVLVLLVPTEGGYHIEAVQWMDENRVSDTPATEEVKKDCFEIFFDGLASVGKSITLDRALTVEELSQVQTYLTAAEVRAVISAAWNKPYYRPQDISLYEILYADNTNTISTKEAILLTGDTLMTGEWSRMTADEIGNLMKKYTGIDITQSMLDDMVADQVDQDGKVVSQGAHYLSEYDAYYIQHTDAGGMYPINIRGEWTADGKIVAHMQSAGPMDHVVVLLIPQEDSYWIEAVQWMDENRVTDDPNVQ